MPRPQFTLRALLVAMLVVAAFFGGMAAQSRLTEPTTLLSIEADGRGESFIDVIRLRDGSVWERLWRRQPDDWGEDE